MATLKNEKSLEKPAKEETAGGSEKVPEKAGGKSLGDARIGVSQKAGKKKNLRAYPPFCRRKPIWKERKLTGGGRGSFLWGSPSAGIGKTGWVATKNKVE